MGTRRPLVLQMVHDPSATTPRCRLRDEDSQQYGDPITPESSVSDAIRQRTESHLRSIGASVSSKPIFLRAECAMCLLTRLAIVTNVPTGLPTAAT